MRNQRYSLANLLHLVFVLILVLLSLGFKPEHVFASTLFSDFFTGTNSTSLTIHNSIWSDINVNDNTAGTAIIQNNELQAGVNGENDDILLTGISATDSCVSTDILFPGGTAGASHELFLRRSGSQTGIVSNEFSYINYADNTTGIGWSVASSCR